MNMRKKRGQVAMEFLMTYGWAIIIILLAVAALWYLGVFKASITSRCEVKAPFNCASVKVVDVAAADRAIIVLGATGISSSTTNNKLTGVTVNGVACTKFARGEVPGGTDTGIALVDATQTNDVRFKRQVISCETASDIGGVGDKFSGQFDITYEQDGGGAVTHKIQGSLAGEVEKA